MSGMGRLVPRDLARGAVMAALTAFLTACQQALSMGDVDPTAWNWKTIGGVTLAAVLAYLLKNLLSTDNGKFVGKVG